MKTLNRCKVHKYKRVVLSRNKYSVYKCVNCPHYVPEPLVIGRECECWVCGNTFLMTRHSLLLKPRCENCKNKRIKIERISQGAGMDDSKIKVLKIRTKKTDPDLESAKSDILNHLMSKLNS